MSARLGRILTPHGSRALDALVMGGLVVADVVGIAVDEADGRLPGAGRRAWVLVVAVAVAAAFRWRRTRPLAVAGCVVAGYVLVGTVHERGLVTQRTGVQLVLAVYAVSSWSVRHRRLGAALAGAVGVLAALGAAGDGGGAAQVVALPVAAVGAPWFAGVAARQRRRHLAGVEERLAAAEADREERARRAVTDERSRIARDLHDVVAHHVSLIGVQAGAARTTLGPGDEGARRSLAGIEASSREAVREMRRLLDVLDPGDGEPLDPPRRVGDVRALAAGFAAAGLAVDVDVTGEDGAVGPGRALALYRIAQEALTNVTRHSSARSCRVAVSVGPAGARLVVYDPGPSLPRAPVPPPGAGRGLVGMRERVALFGGTLTAGPAADGGFVVDAFLPAAP